MSSNIDRRALRALPDELVAIAMEAIDDYGAEFKFRKNVLYVFAPDGSTPLTVGPKDAGPAVKKARSWMNKHFPEPPKTRKKTARKKTPQAPTDEQLQELADKFNAENEAKKVSAENEVKEIIDWRARQDSERARQEAEREWVTHVSAKRGPSAFFEQNTVTGKYRCKECVGTPHEFPVDAGPTSFGGHIRMWHTDRTGLYSEESLRKRVETRKRNEEAQAALSEDAEPEVAPEHTEGPKEDAEPSVEEYQAMAIKQRYVIGLAEDLGLRVVDGDLAEENDWLAKEVDRLEKEIVDRDQRLSDALAKLSLLKEQFQAAFEV